MSAVLTFLQERSPSILALLFLSGSYVIYSLLLRVITGYHQFKIIKEHGCKSIPSYPHKDPVFGLDLFLENLELSKSGGLVQRIRERFQNINGGVNTFTQNMLGAKVINTIEPENIKAILATQFKDFSLPPRRKDSFQPVFGHGIFTTDDKEWEASRALLRPSFARSYIGDLEVFESHISKMIAKIPRDGSTVDLQELFFRLTLDSATEFLFGESSDVLGDGEATARGVKFGETFQYVTEKVGLTARVGKLATILPDKEFTDGTKYVHEYVGNYVRKTIEQNKKYAALGEEAEPESKYVFLEHLAKTGYSEKKIQDELLNILLAGRDTTAGLLAHLWYIIARRPDVFEKLKAEVLSLGNKMPTFEQIKEMKYLQYCLNEALRLHPVVPLNGRTAVKDTTLPLGGGPDGKSPIFIPKGTQVNYQVWVMHRREEYYGKDADEFKPERWESLRPSWQFLPFNGGPRICIGQQFALTEASYTTIRLLQAFASIEPRDSRDYKELLTVTMAVRGGVQVGVTRS